MEQRRIRFADAEFLGAPGIIKARANLGFSHIGIAVGQGAELELTPQGVQHRLGIGIEHHLMPLGEECRKGLARRRFGFAARDAVVYQEPLNKRLPKQADVVRQLWFIFEELTAQVCDLLPRGGRQCERGWGRPRGGGIVRARLGEADGEGTLAGEGHPGHGAGARVPKAGAATFSAP